MHPIWLLASVLTVRRLYTRVLTRANSIYLTFDDGPDAEHTPRMLDLLAQHGARATFFLRGDNAERHTVLTRRLVTSGHTLGNHSYSHRSFERLGWRHQAEEIERTDRVLERFDGRRRHVFRPPYGRLTPPALALCVLRRQRVALWTHDSLDFRLDTAAIVQRLHGLPIRGGDIILFHDDAPPGIAALDQVLPIWRAAGFEFLPL
jgi:peptidoglycan/xylan/chitin deacetylase (PgdA/CDA1 family)